jgi:hypothetical protein
MYGWKKDKFDHRALLHPIPRKIPDRFVLFKLPEVRNQGQLSACVGFGIGGNITHLGYKLGVSGEWFAPMWIYNGARFIEGRLTEDGGCYPVDALKWLQRKGCLQEHFWPYTGIFSQQAPPSKFDNDAGKYSGIMYYRVVGDLGGLCSAIAAGHIVSLGSPWFDEWVYIGSSGVLPQINANSSVGGGHETFLYGYDLKSHVFYGQNSWGPEWGTKGRYVMHFSSIEVFKQLGGYDAHYIDVPLRWGM